MTIHISIHTPTKGATAKARDTITMTLISIHTPTKGATEFYRLVGLMQQISIHTPTKGATTVDEIIGSRNRHFNPHSHEGSDLGGRGIGKTYGLFQSTLPRRERPVPRQGFYGLYIISIHTPTKGATQSYADVKREIEISIHTPTKGATKSD